MLVHRYLCKDVQLRCKWLAVCCVSVLLGIMSLMGLIHILGDCGNVLIDPRSLSFWVRNWNCQHPALVTKPDFSVCHQRVVSIVYVIVINQMLIVSSAVVVCGVPEPQSASYPFSASWYAEGGQILAYRNVTIALIHHSDMFDLCMTS